MFLVLTPAAAKIKGVKVSGAMEASRAGLTPPPQTGVRHAIRPLSVFSFCGQPITGSRDERQLDKDLPLCPDCKRHRDEATLLFGGRRRKRD